MIVTYRTCLMYCRKPAHGTSSLKLVVSYANGSGFERRFRRCLRVHVKGRRIDHTFVGVWGDYTCECLRLSLRTEFAVPHRQAVDSELLTGLSQPRG